MIVPLWTKVAVAAGALGIAAAADAQQIAEPGKLLLTNGIGTIEGASGGGLTPWAVIAGNATRDGIGVQASATAAELKDYDFQVAGVAIGALDRVELSYARQRFDTNWVGGALGLGNDYKFDQDVWGAKVKLAGDMVYGSEWMPSIAAGVYYKRSLDAPIVRAVGARKAEGTDLYVSATKLFLRWSLLANVTLRATNANQNGLLGFGGDKRNARTIHPEGSLAYQVSRRFVVGGEFRSKPDNLGIAREDDWFDAFAAYALNRNLTATVAFADLGSVATVEGQRGVLFQIQGSF
ncbi:hypothetical protein COC42_11940 [Sphingomonas spermidinifaciens]|uniref:DUF3034 domain-containing protein n=1 Tax=Sphingomonas spermidinifaciens TaxID=1141889 RepID=A0A2A4B154_9SPHN|nr:DUF3034 family protein [Sphingomonas spermidinifaciens]PCD02171.1 hypothetical protein COC42_11940 [Sphingomonas spermidinifaciens]